MLSKVEVGPYSVRGVSLGGLYTALQIPELKLLLDAGMAPRSFVGTDTLLLSHGHVDHVGGLGSLLGMRGLMAKESPLRVIMPTEIAPAVDAMLVAMTDMQRYDLSIESVGMKPGDTIPLSGDLFVRAFRTHHPVPSLGYEVVRRVKKLKKAYQHLEGAEIGRRRQRGEPLFDEVETIELAYATDTLIEALDQHPTAYQARVLILSLIHI